MDRRNNTEDENLDNLVHNPFRNETVHHRVFHFVHQMLLEEKAKRPTKRLER